MTDNPRQMTPSPGGTYVLCAGGTGGHMVPAHCLALELMARGHKVHLVTDERGLRFPGLFPGVPVTKVDAASTGRSGWRSLPQV
ncbi:glycosyltransferase, partial [Sandarakinorhabdus sp.]|uniref:glycosyltransferase n=1 Tax=Sandarakinorhabdus sp. TaxID=1916663 RepID=UPI0038F71C7E